MPAPVMAGTATRTAQRAPAVRNVESAGTAIRPQPATSPAPVPQSPRAASGTMQNQRPRRRTRPIRAPRATQPEEAPMPKLFPIIPFSFALMVDITEWFGINYYLFYIPNLLAACVIIPWVWLNRNKAESIPFMRMGGILAIEWTPIVGDVTPGWTTLVLWTWWKAR